MRLSQEPRYPRLPLSSFSLEFLHLRDSTFPYPLSKLFVSRPRYPRLRVFSPSVSSFVSPSHSYSHSGSPLSEYSHFSRLNQNPPSNACRTNSEFLTGDKRTSALRPGQMQARMPPQISFSSKSAPRVDATIIFPVLHPFSLLQSPTRTPTRIFVSANQDFEPTPDSSPPSACRAIPLPGAQEQVRKYAGGFSRQDSRVKSPADSDEGARDSQARMYMRAFILVH
jgi:hypothetical protein